MSDWVKRPYDPLSRDDEDAVVYLWLKSYAHASHNIARGANKDHTPQERAYWNEHAPIVECLLRSGITQTEVLCPPDRVHRNDAGPPVFLAFACTSGDVIHYVCVKRDAARAGFGPEMVRDLLGDRMKRACVTTHELREMRPRRTGPPPCGVEMPSLWTYDPWWLARGFVGGPRKAAA